MSPMPPLVEPAEPLSAAEMQRYSRHLILPDVGVTGQRRLKNARVLVVGAGGLGSPALLYLAAAGVGTIGVVDADVVDASNLQRQVVHGESDVGRPKVDSAADRVAEVNPHVTVVKHPVHLDSTNALDILRGYDLVLDGTDNFPTRYLVNDACAILGIPEVWGSIFRFDGQVSVFWAGHGPTYRDLFPEPPPPGAVPSCAEGGVLGVLCAAIGSVMATEAVKLVCGIGDSLVGRLMVFDALAMTWRTLNVRPNPALPPITALVDYDRFCGLLPEQTDGAGAVSAATIDVHALRDLLAARERGETDFVLVDVREPYEREIVVIPGAVGVPKADVIAAAQTKQWPADLAEGRRVVLHCKAGGRSAEALGALLAAGRTDAVHVAGGVLAWAREIDPALPTY
ncbi:molybdopterin-synthase adenylyltransferase MoeB [Kineosporia sp. A_224]|uniref:molybdopterin-synthase adenylyltransferase MoeB n=1 Tax=Kineosporia sp. A_224 TaxID=1962180 RepID=UPI000B4B870A|nr:molybdopterin-synthase adenylyltransferase MoeB [Kineosporia sp. A_224]